LKIDANLTDKDRLKWPFQLGAADHVSRLPSLVRRADRRRAPFEGNGHAEVVQRRQSTMSGSSPLRLISEFRFGAAHYHNEAQNSDYGTTASTALGRSGA